MVGEIKAHRASSEAYGYLVRATADICLPRYHYYCQDKEAKLPEELIIVANTRRIPIRDNELIRLGCEDGALEAERIPGKGNDALRFGPVKGRSKSKAMAKWKEALRQDFQSIQEFEPRPNYVCMPEFGFPFGLEYRETLQIPESADSDWRWLQGTEFLTSRFLCLGSSHRRFYRSREKQELQYENVAVVYPSGKRGSLESRTVFGRKLKALARYTKIDDVSFSVKARSRGIVAHFADKGISATLRSDLSSSESAEIEPGQRRFAKNAFDFYDVTADASTPPIYIRKKSPARKLGEYIDAEGKIELDVFVTDLGVISVLICYDAFDPSIFLSAVRMYYESFDRPGDFFHQGIDIFFIPAFNRSQKFVDMCRVLSLETNSVVVYVSGDERCQTKSDVFVCGQPCSTWAEKAGAGGLPSDYYSMSPVSDQEHLRVHRISRELVDMARSHVKRQVSTHVRRSLILTAKRLGSAVLD